MPFARFYTMSLFNDMIRRLRKKPSIKEWESLPVESSVDKGPGDVEEVGKNRDR
jgi:hypothetical protein